MRSHSIYILIDPLDGLVKYVGQSTNIIQRYKAYCNPVLRLKKTGGYKSNNCVLWCKSLKDKGLKPILEIIDVVEDWKFWEPHYISLYKSWGFILKNMHPGGSGGQAGMIPWNKGKSQPQSDTLKNSIKTRMILGTMGAKPGILHPLYGKHPSKETKEKCRLSHIGKIYKPNTIAVDLLDKNLKIITSYDCIKIASKETKCHVDNINKCCKGLSRKTKGCYWKFKDQDYICLLVKKVSWNKGLKTPTSVKEKQSISGKGRKTWNKGIKWKLIKNREIVI
jgi:hypothetical protein